MVKIRLTGDRYILDEQTWSYLIKTNNEFRNDSNSLNRCNLFVSFINYLNWIIDYCNDELKGKEYRDEQIIRKVFITKVNKENQIKEYLKYSLVPLKEYVCHIKKVLKYKDLENYYTLIMTLLTDAGCLIRDYEVTCKGTSGFGLLVGGRKTMTPFDLLNVSTELFNIEAASSINQLSIIDLKPNVMFQIRQLLEIVGKNLIGFDFVVDRNGKPIHQFTQVAWTFLSSIKENDATRKWSVFLPYKAKDMFAINCWTNSFVHTTYFNTCYLQYYALRIVQDFMRPPCFQQSIFGNSWNINIGKYEIENYHYLRQDFIKYVNRQNPNANVVWQPLKKVGACIKSYGSPKVLFIMHMPPPVHGASMMGEVIKDSDLINRLFAGTHLNLATSSSISNIGRFSLKKVTSFIKLLLDVCRNVKHNKPKLVYITPNATGGAFLKDFIVVQMLKWLGCKVVAHYHNKGVSTKQNSRIYNWAYSRFFKGLKVILLSPILYDDVKKYIKSADVFYCANGIAESNPGMKPIRNNPVPKLLFLSNLIESKGVIILLDALKLLKDRGYSFVCTFVGAESQEINADRFDALVKERKLVEVAEYVGKKYDEEKQRIYEESDIFVFPTYYHNECFPLVLLEAMECALPCISTNEGAISDIIDDGKTGYVVEKKNAEDLANKIELLLNNRQLREDMGRAGKLKFEQEYTLKLFEERMADILSQV